MEDGTIKKNMISGAPSLNFRRGELLLNILSSVGDAAVNAAAIFEVFLKTRYGDSSGLMWRMDEKTRKLAGLRAKRDFKRQEQSRFSDLLYRLKRDGLLEDAHGDSRSGFKLTDAGRAKLKDIRGKGRENLPNINQYETKNSPIFTLVVFDIPEATKRKREWLRRALAGLGLSMVQKSVWMGKVKIPQEFVKDLRELEILKFVEILEITKTGTLVSVGR